MAAWIKYKEMKGISLFSEINNGFRILLDL